MSEKKKSGLDWLYDQNAIKKQNREEYLLGKRFVLPEKDDDMRQLNDKNVAGSTFLDNKTEISAYVDRQNKVFSDPMLAIEATRLKQRRRLLMNPAKMQKIKDSLHKKKKSKKKKHKSKKKKKRRRSSSSSSDSDSESDRRSQKRKRSRSRKRRRENDREREREWKKARRDSRRSASASGSESESDPPPARKLPEKRMFGLIHPKGQESAAILREDKKREKKEKKQKKKKKEKKKKKTKQPELRSSGQLIIRENERGEVVRSKIRWRSTIENSKSVKDLTQEERLALLKEMEDEATSQEKNRENKILKRDEEIAKEREEFKKREFRDRDSNVGFIHEMEKQAFGISGQGPETLEERLHKTKQWRQRGDINKATFLPRHSKY